MRTGRALKIAAAVLASILLVTVILAAVYHRATYAVFKNLTVPTVKIDQSPWAGGASYEGVPYAADSENQYLDLYVPETDGALPKLYVIIHGGGFITNDSQSKQAQLMYRYFRDHGYACASINYRLAQEAPFPAGLSDCKAAIRFLRAHAGEYGYDAEHIAVFGESAGGYLAVMCGVTEDGEFADVAFLGQKETGDVSAKVDVVVNYYGHIDHSGMEDDWAVLGIPQTVVNIANSWVSGDVLQGFENIESFWFRRNVSEMTAEEYAYSDPNHYIEKNELAGLSMWIIHGDCDITVPYLHSERLAAKLAQKLGTGAVSYHLIPGMGHASDPLYSDELLGQLKDYLDQMLE